MRSGHRIPAPCQAPGLPFLTAQLWLCRFAKGMVGAGHLAGEVTAGQLTATTGLLTPQFCFLPTDRGFKVLSNEEALQSLHLCLGNSGLLLDEGPGCLVVLSLSSALVCPALSPHSELGFSQAQRNVCVCVCVWPLPCLILGNCQAC